MLRIAIDGACRRNGKPDCVAAGGVFIMQYKDFNLVATDTKSNYEHNSTNQRGELLALLTALDYVYAAGQTTQIITDSEYIFNAMTKQWYTKWRYSGWVTASGEPVKDADIWREIAHSVDKCAEMDIDIMYYHIKGHCIPFGRVTAERLMDMDRTCMLIYGEISKKYDAVKTTKAANLAAAQELSVKNNGFNFSDEILKEFVVANAVADAVATSVVEAADRKI